MVSQGSQGMEEKTGKEEKRGKRGKKGREGGEKEEPSRMNSGMAQEPGDSDSSAIAPTASLCGPEQGPCPLWSSVPTRSKEGLGPGMISALSRGWLSVTAGGSQSQAGGMPSLASAGVGPGYERPSLPSKALCRGNPCRPRQQLSCSSQLGDLMSLRLEPEGMNSPGSQPAGAQAPTLIRDEVLIH